MIVVDVECMKLRIYGDRARLTWRRTKRKYLPGSCFARIITHGMCVINASIHRIATPRDKTIDLVGFQTTPILQGVIDWLYEWFSPY